MVINHTPIEHVEVDKIRSFLKHRNATFIHSPLHNKDGEQVPFFLTEDHGLTEEVEASVLPIVSTYQTIESCEITIDHRFLDKGYDLEADKEKYDNVMIVLNQRIDHEDLFHRLMSVTDVVICTDGAANRFLDYTVSSTYEIYSTYYPDYIIGDFDSL